MSNSLIINFKDINNKEIINDIKKNYIESIKNNTKTYDISMNDLNKLKNIALKELDDFKDDVEDFLENINQLTIFQNIGEDLINCYIITLCIDEIANNYLYPIIKGEYDNSIFESEDDFNILRTEMFKKLADKYLDL